MNVTETKEQELTLEDVIKQLNRTAGGHLTGAAGEGTHSQGFAKGFHDCAKIAEMMLKPLIEKHNNNAYALKEIAFMANRTGTDKQFINYLQQFAEQALNWKPNDEPLP